MPQYQNADLPADQRVADLLARMTLEEKVAQMMCVWKQKATKLVDAQAKFDDREGPCRVRRRQRSRTGRTSERRRRRHDGARPRPS